MFEVPQPVDTEEDQYDGVPLVQLHDHPEDLQAFLRALYDPSFIPEGRLNPAFLQVMQGPLKLAQKYEVESLREKTIIRLKTEWPSDLATFDRRETEISEDPQIERYPSANRAVALVKAGGLQDRLVREFATIRKVASHADNFDQPVELSDYEVLFHSQNRFASAVGRYNPPLFTRCASGKCNRRRPAIQSRIISDFANPPENPCFFTGLKAFIHEMRQKGSTVQDLALCNACLDECADHLGELRQDLFRQLPELFNTSQYLAQLARLISLIRINSLAMDSSQISSPVINRVAGFKFKLSVTDEQKAEARDGLINLFRDLRHLLHRELRTGSNNDSQGFSKDFDIVFTAEFKDEKSRRDFNDSEEHQKFKDLVLSLAEDVIVYDFIDGQFIY
ncbi:hypothetical protein HGRIS_013891 [Hohenbuehelia grisea]|uniref:Stress-response A/B barrel domain-containing protein n=1 Tax=Hohenbuehelia grisea TaxID=104357 RepID=A0ABR3IX26_9AGAR